MCRAGFVSLHPTLDACPRVVRVYDCAALCKDRCWLGPAQIYLWHQRQAASLQVVPEIEADLNRGYRG